MLRQGKTEKETLDRMLNVLVRHTAKRHTSIRQASVMDFTPFNNSIFGFTAVK